MVVSMLSSMMALCWTILFHKMRTAACLLLAAGMQWPVREMNPKNTTALSSNTSRKDEENSKNCFDNKRLNRFAFAQNFFLYKSRIRVSIQSKFKVSENVQSPFAWNAIEWRFRAVATVLDGGQLQPGQTRAQIVRSVGVGAILVGIFTFNGWHSVGRITSAAGASLFQVFPQTFSEIRSWRLLRAHLIINGYFAQVMCCPFSSEQAFGL